MRELPLAWSTSSWRCGVSSKNAGGCVRKPSSVAISRSWLEAPMLHLLDEALETFLRAAVPLPAHEYAVSFEAPDKQWAAGRAASTPTVNAYLREVRPNTSMRESG